MSDDLVISGGGYSVATEAMLARGEALRRAKSQLDSATDRIYEVMAAIRLEQQVAKSGTPLASAGAGPGALDPAIDRLVSSIDSTWRRARTVSHQVGVLSTEFGRALTLYTTVENLQETLWRAVNEDVAFTLGFITREVIVPVALSVAPGLIAEAFFTGQSPLSLVGEMASSILPSRVPATSAAVGAVRRGVEDTAPFLAGFAGLPLPIEKLIGPNGANVLGLPVAAALIAAGGTLVGDFRETGVTVKLKDSERAQAVTPDNVPRTLAQRADLIPALPDSHTDPKVNEQVRILKYSQPGKPDRFDVFVEGTKTFDPVTAKEPSDLTSDIRGVAQQNPGEYRAVIEAMKKAGVTPTSPVVLNGYSQGGLIAAEVASKDTHLNVRGLVTYGAPIGGITTGPHIARLELRNAEDIVPATGGYDRDPAAVIATRTLYDKHAAPDWSPVPAHEFYNYEKTAQLTDASDDVRVRGALKTLDGFADGATRVQSMEFQGTRVHRSH